MKNATIAVTVVAVMGICTCSAFAQRGHMSSGYHGSQGHHVGAGHHYRPPYSPHYRPPCSPHYRPNYSPHYRSPHYSPHYRPYYSPHYRSSGYGRSHGGVSIHGPRGGFSIGW